MPPAHWEKKSIESGGGRLHTRVGRRSECLPTADLCLGKLSDELTMIRDTAKESLVCANSVKAFGDRKWSHPHRPMGCSLLSRGIWITSLWRSPQRRAAADQ